MDGVVYLSAKVNIFTFFNVVFILYNNDHIIISFFKIFDVFLYI